MAAFLSLWKHPHFPLEKATFCFSNVEHSGVTISGPPIWTSLENSWSRILSCFFNLDDHAHLPKYASLPSTWLWPSPSWDDHWWGVEESEVGMRQPEQKGRWDLFNLQLSFQDLFLWRVSVSLGHLCDLSMSLALSPVTYIVSSNKWINEYLQNKW